MNSELVEKAAKVITNPPVLINLISKRVKQLQGGSPPLVRVSARMSTADIALTEVIEHKIFPIHPTVETMLEE